MQEAYTIPNGNNRKNVKGHISLYSPVANTSSLSFGWDVCNFFLVFT